MPPPPTPEQVAEQIRARAEAIARKLSKDAEAEVVFCTESLIYLTILLKKRGSVTRDGPAAPNQFWFGGECVELGPKPWKLLHSLWSEGRMVVATLYERVWGSGPVNRDNLRQAVHRANVALASMCGMMVHLEDDRVSLEGAGLEYGRGETHVA